MNISSIVELRKGIMRNCEICGSRQKENLHLQDFVLPETESIVGYGVVACSGCGFAFADNIPSKQDYENYYKLSSKYAYGNCGGEEPEGIRNIHQVYFKIVDDFLQKNGLVSDKHSFKILDIGCGSGAFLNFFKEQGYTNLSGLDASSKCSQTAKELYDIKVSVSSLAEFKSSQGYDLIILSGVLEHLKDLSDSIIKIKSLLKEKGLLFVLVPDTANFNTKTREPFLEFSPEHINYFTVTSLNNLMSKAGLENLYNKSLNFEDFGFSILSTFYGKTKDKKSLEKDSKGVTQLKEYINSSLTKLETLKSKIDKIVDSKKEIIIWAVGSLTFRLLATTNLAKANIVAFVDSNPGLINKQIKGLNILSPRFLEAKDATVFICSFNYQNQIRDILTNELNFKGEIITV